MRHQRLNLTQAHPLLDRLLHADQANTVLVLEKLADGANTTVTEVVDIIHLTLVVLEINQLLNHEANVFAGQGCLLKGLVNTELVVDLQTPDP